MHPPSPENLPERILFVRLGAIGDVVNALTVAAAVKDFRSATQVGWLVHPLAAPLVQRNPVVDRVHLLPKSGWWRAWKALRPEVRGEGYGLVVDLQRMLKSAYLARSVRAPRLLGYDRDRAKEGSGWLYRERIPGGPRHAHMVTQYAQFSAYLTGSDGVRHALPDLPTEAIAWAATWSSGTSRPIVVHVGASKPENRWSPGSYVELVGGLLAETDRPVILTGGPGDREDAQPTCAAHGGHARFHDLVGQTDLLQLLALLRHARLWIGCDTGPMHLAAASGVPVLALFGPADPRRTGPWGAGHRVLRASLPEADGPLLPASMDQVSSLHTLECALETLTN